MDEAQALAAMTPPGAQKNTPWLNGVIQIWITRACDKSCFNCTQASNFGGNPGMITPENFEKAVISLKDYHGVVGMIGGNPCLHPKFEQLCDILAQHIPSVRRGLWSNNPLDKGAICRRTFNPAFSNLNVHLDADAYARFKRDWPECQPVGLTTDSKHSPVWGSMLDLTDLPEEERWRRISQCDINHNWSGMYGQFRGELRWWFCEIAAAQAMLRQHQPDYPDTGLKLDGDYGGRQPWQLSMSEYADQVRWHCQRCLVPMKGLGEFAQAGVSGIEQYTQEYAGVVKPKTQGRLVQLVTTAAELRKDGVGHVTDYIKNAQTK